MKGLALAERPFYAERLDARGHPAPWTLEDLEDHAVARRDPFAGRRLADAPLPALSLQLEACDDPPVWTGLSPGELERWSRALDAIWRRHGVSPGECVALFDYGSSPLVLLASASYAPHLRRGAAERLGVHAICNDGVATLAERLGEILRHLRPAALFLRRDVLAPLDEVLRTRGLRLADHCRWVAVGDVDGASDRSELERATRAWDVPVHRVLRADAGFVLASECPRCRAFHLPASLYRVTPLEDGVAVTARFARTCPAVAYRLEGVHVPEGACAAEPDAWRVAT
jgi:hypothetical protein